MAPSDIKDLLQTFVDYVCLPGTKDDSGLLRICDNIVAAYHSANYTFDNQDYPEAPKEDYSVRRAKISNLFPDYGFYSLTSIEMENFASDTMIGDAIDDLTDLSQDFDEVIWCFEHTSVADAIWQFSNGYWIHWGRHIRELQLYLFRRVTGS